MYIHEKIQIVTTLVELKFKILEVKVINTLGQRLAHEFHFGSCAEKCLLVSDAPVTLTGQNMTGSLGTTLTIPCILVGRSIVSVGLTAFNTFSCSFSFFSTSLASS